MFEIERTNNQWEKYGLLSHDLTWNGKQENYRAIVKNGRLVGVTSREYVLLPNEEAVSIAEETANEMGAKPFSEFGGDWFIKMNDHVIQTGRNHDQVHALYAWDTPVDIGGGDTIQLGFAIHNSIDRSMGFGAGLFTFRHACANMVFMGFKGQSMEFDERQTVSWMYNKHVGNFSPDRNILKGNITTMLQNGVQIIEQYRDWKNRELQKETFGQLKKSLPNKYVPDSLMIKSLSADVPKVKTMWDAYNDVTALIWHNDKTDYASKKILFDRLHTAMAVVR